MMINTVGGEWKKDNGYFRKIKIAVILYTKLKKTNCYFTQTSRKIVEGGVEYNLLKF